MKLVLVIAVLIIAAAAVVIPVALHFSQATKSNLTATQGNASTTAIIVTMSTAKLNMSTTSAPSTTSTMVMNATATTNNTTTTNKTTNGTVTTATTATVTVATTTINGSTVVISTTTTSNVTTTTIITTTNPTVSITRPGDPIVGICNTVAGGSIVGVAANYPATEIPENAIDSNITTKYLNFGDNTEGCTGSNPAGINTGFVVIPTISGSSLVVGVQFATANDAPERDPITITLEGSTQTDQAALLLGTSWTLIYSGSTGISATSDLGRLEYIAQQSFVNTMRFASYRLLVTSKRNSSGNSVQYSEANLFGYV